MSLTANINTPTYTSRAYNAANFSVSGGAISPSSDEYIDRYKVINKTLIWHFNLIVDFTSTPDYVMIKLPSTYVSKSTVAGTGVFISGETNIYYSLSAADNKIYIQKDGGSLTDASTQISFNLTLEIE